MNNDWINKLKYYYESGTEGVKLIYVFTISSLIYWILNFILLKATGFSLQSIIFLSADEFIPYFWTLFTFPFVQKDLWDLLFLMLMIYFSEKIFRIYFDGRSFIKFFFLGNLSGGIFFLLYSFITKNTFVYLEGTITGIYSVLFAVISYNPKMRVSLFPLPIQFSIYILGLLFIGLDAISTLNSPFIAGIFVARVAAAAFGYFYMKSFQTGNDFLGKLIPDFSTIHKKFSLLKMKFFTHNKIKKEKNKYKTTNSRPQSDEEFNEKKLNKQKQIDAILDKISKRGYENLTKEEKEFLFNSSKEL